jgi:hypothetical protein
MTTLLFHVRLNAPLNAETLKRTQNDLGAQVHNKQREIDMKATHVKKTENDAEYYLSQAAVHKEEFIKAQKALPKSE